MPQPVIFSNVDLKPNLPQGFTSTVGEPSTARTGDVAMMSGNWYAARSLDGGANWQHLSPFTFFPQADDGFCCDQTFIYDETRDIFIWLLQYVSDKTRQQNTLRVAVCPSAEVVNDGWHFWDLVPEEVDSSWTNNWFDYNHAALSDNFLYVGTNMFSVVPGRFTRCVVFRLSLDELLADGDLTLDHFETTEFSLRCTQGATDTMYFGAHVDRQTIRVFSWPEQGGGVTSVDIPITQWTGRPYSAPANGSGNWMGRGDERITAAWTADGQIGFMWTAGRQGTTRPQPFVRAVRIDAASLTLADEPDIWHPDIAFGWPEISPNNRGDLGVSLFFGGGQFHPSHAVGVRTAADPVWRLRIATQGTHSPNDGKWGDYVHARPNRPDGVSWVTCAFTLQGGGEMNDIHPRFVHFGIETDRDTIFPNGGVPIA